MRSKYLTKYPIRKFTPSRMTQLTAYLCLNIMILKTTSSAIIILTWPWPVKEEPLSQGSSTGVVIKTILSSVVGCISSFLNYRYWNLLGTMMAGLCLPVDVLIFYKEKAHFENIMNHESLCVWCLILGTTRSGGNPHFPCLGLYTFLCHDLWCCLPWEAINYFGKRFRQIFQESASLVHFLLQMVNWELF